MNEATTLLPIPVDEYAGGEDIELASKSAVQILVQAKETQITDESSNQEAVDLLDRARSSKKYLNKARLEPRLELTAPLNAYVGDINAKYKARVAPLEEADNILSKKTSDYHMEKVRKQQEEEARIEKERREREAKLAAEQRLENMRAEAEVRKPEEIKPPKAPEPEVVPEVKKTTETSSGSKMTMREHTDVEIISGQEDLVPREFCSPDIKKARDAVAKNPDIQIPGIRITKTYKPAQSG